jgi:hypothetical protein
MPDFNDVRNVMRFAGAFNPALNVLSAATELGYGLLSKNKEDEASGRSVGTVTSILGGKPFKVYAGEDYGDQSVDTYLKLRQANPTKFPEIKGAPKPPTPGARSGGTAVPPVTADWEGGAAGTPSAPAGGIPDATQGWGTDRDVNTGTYPAEVKTPGSEPGFDAFAKQIEKALSDEYLTKRTDEAIRQFVATSSISQALGAEKSRERYKREVELERMKQWTDLQKATMQTNLLSNALLGQAFISAQQPSAAMADVLAKGTQAAQGALGGSFQLKV